MNTSTFAASALAALLCCFSHAAWTQEVAAPKKIRIGMPNRGVPNLHCLLPIVSASSASTAWTPN